jgi:nickel/cobalt transporter (NiCoT) family protein
MSGSGALKESHDGAPPIGRFSKVRRSLTRQEWTKVGLMAATVVVLNVVGWGMLALALHGHSHLNRTAFFGFGTGVLAYTLGMRHAFDADHIAAIDNTTRKLIQDGERPLSVGYFFSLGHSTIVFVLAVLLNFGIRALNGAVKNNNSASTTGPGSSAPRFQGPFCT